MSFDSVIDSKVVTHLASDARPGRCSSSGIVPNALAIRVPVRNTTVPNCARNTGLDTYETKVWHTYPIHDFRTVFEMGTAHVASLEKPAVSPFFCIFLEPIEGQCVRA